MECRGVSAQRSAAICWRATRTHLSSVAARMYLPLGENLTNDTGGLSSSGKHKEEGGGFYCLLLYWLAKTKSSCLKKSGENQCLLLSLTQLLKQKLILTCCTFLKQKHLSKIILLVQEKIDDVVLNINRYVHKFGSPKVQ